MKSSPTSILETPFASSSLRSETLAIPRIAVFLLFHLLPPCSLGQEVGPVSCSPLLCPVGRWRSSGTPHPSLLDITTFTEGLARV